MSNQDVAETGACCSPLNREPLTEDWAGDLARMFKALGDPVRLRLLSLVASHEGGEACVCDISDTFDLSQPTISHHLKVLRQAGLLDCERRGTWVYYWVIPAALQQLSRRSARGSIIHCRRRPTGDRRMSAPSVPNTPKSSENSPPSTAIWRSGSAWPWSSACWLDAGSPA